MFSMVGRSVIQFSGGGKELMAELMKREEGIVSIL